MFARDHSFSSETDNSSNTGLGKPLGSYPHIQHEMLSRNAAQQRPGHRPPAPQAFHQLPWAQTYANGCMTPQLKQNQPGATTAAEGSVGISRTICTSLIPGGPPSPSPLSSTTHHAMPTPQPTAPTTIGEAQKERRAHQAPHYSIQKGNEQAGSSSLQLGGRSTPAAVTPTVVRCTLQLTSPAEFGTPHMHRQARDLPFGAAHEQAKLAMDPKPANNKQIILDDRGKLQARAHAPEVRQVLKHRTTHMHGPALDLPFGTGHEQAKLAMNPTPANNKQINSDNREKLQKCAKAPEVKTHGGNTLIQLQRLARNAPHLPRADGYVQAGSSGLQLRGESMPHATLAWGQNIL